VLCYLVLLFSWQIFINFTPLTETIEIISRIQKTLFRFDEVQVQVTYAIRGYPSNAILYHWLQVELLVGLAGAFVFWKKEKQKKVMQSGWFTNTCFWYLILLLLIVMPSFSRALYTDRFVSYALVFIVVPISYLLTKLDVWAKPRAHFERRVIKALVILFVFLYIPINMNVFSTGNLFYHSENETGTKPEIIAWPILRESQLGFADWLNLYASNKIVSVDLLGMRIAKIGGIRYDRVDYPRSEGYLIMHTWFYESGLWIHYGPQYEYLYYPSEKRTFENTQLETNILFSTKTYRLFQSP